jgi:DNA adenine methylase
MKYMGSKDRIAKDILPIILKDRSPDQWYIEPFCGGCNIIDKVQGNRIANDSNMYLIEMWKALLNGWQPIEISKEQYTDIKNNSDKYPLYLIGWTAFNCSYSGKWFGGYAGTVNTKVGTIRNYQREAINNINKQLPKLKNIIFQNDNYRNIEIPDNSIIYCDPPYSDTTKYFDKFDSEKFWEWVRTITNKGHKVFISEYKAPKDFECIWEKEIKSSLSANGKIGGNKISVEKLFKLK